MLSVTISVLQLREVLHPGIFGKIIKPQEAHADLITSLINESGFVHTRRILVSCCVYAFLLMLLVYSPILVYEYINNSIFSLNIFTFSFWYFIPQIQIPLELLLGHIIFLSIVDKNKDIIGHLQHYWLVYICDKLQLTKYILPLPMIKKVMSLSLSVDAVVI
jgi:E3 ubiquitin-protein ligase MARCH6